MSTPAIDQEIQIRRLENLVGHTIKAVIENPSGKRDVSAVLITETGCWLALDADGGTCDEKPYVTVDPPYAGSSDVPLSEYLTAVDMMHAGLINLPTYELLRAKEREALAAERNAYADRLRREGRPHFNPAENGVALDAPWVDHMREDIRALMLCDEIHLLPGWQNSRGARIELDLAVALGLRVWEVQE